MKDKDFELLLQEIRENRKEIQNVKLDVNTMKVKFAAITFFASSLFGFMAAYLKGKLGQ